MDAWLCDLAPRGQMENKCQIHATLELISEYLYQCMTKMAVCRQAAWCFGVLAKT